jgi:hypothetical protein
MILNADDMIDEYMIAQVKDEENWEKVAKKILGINFIYYSLSSFMEGKRSIFLPPTR